MEAKETPTGSAPTARAFMLKKAWLTITLCLLAIAAVVLGFYFNSQPEWAERSDIKLYNQGVTAFQQPATELLPADGDRPEEYPIVRAAIYFQQAAAASNDDRLVALSLYNLGTMMGADALTVLSGETPWFGLAEAIVKLEEAVRTDPYNEDAKHNLELLGILQNAAAQETKYLDLLLAVMEQKPGYYPGEIDPGY
jgi:hypothetical protein